MKCMIGIAELHRHQYKITGCKTYSLFIEIHDWHCRKCITVIENYRM